MRDSDNINELSDITQENENVPDDFIPLKNICESEYVGKVITAIKDETKGKCFRIQGCNPNGLQVKKRGGDFNEFYKESIYHQVDMSC